MARAVTPRSAVVVLGAVALAVAMVAGLAPAAGAAPPVLTSQPCHSAGPPGPGSAVGRAAAQARWRLLPARVTAASTVARRRSALQPLGR